MAERTGVSGRIEEFGEVGRTKGAAFRLLLLACTLAGIVALGALLVYVSYQAFALQTASPTWFAIYGVTLVVPTAATVAALRRREGAVEFGVAAGVAVFAGTMLAAGVGVFFVVVNPVTWFATATAVAVAAAATGIVNRYSGLSETPRVFVAAALFGLALFGVPGVAPSLATAIANAPTLPSDFVVLVLTLVAPVGAVVAAFVARTVDDRETGLLAGGASVLAVSAVGYAIGLATGFSPDSGVLIPLFGLLPAGVFAWATVHDDRRRAVGLALPGVVAGGALAGAAAVDALGVESPESWVNWQFLTNAPSTFSPESAGVFPAVVGSLLLMIVVVVLSFPIGVGAAVYLEEYATDSRFTRFVQVNISNLAGVPSVVYGLLGLAVFINVFGMDTGSVAVGGMALGLLILPIVVISAQEAIRSVPESARQASYGMGATRWQTIRNVVLPQAFPGILTGTILALGRAIGETAPLIMIAAPALYSGIPDSFSAPAAALPLQIYDLAFLPQDAFREGFVPAGVVTLLIVLLTMNGVAIVLRNRYQNQT